MSVLCALCVQSFYRVWMRIYRKWKLRTKHLVASCQLLAALLELTFPTEELHTGISSYQWQTESMFFDFARGFSNMESPKRRRSRSASNINERHLAPKSSQVILGLWVTFTILAIVSALMSVPTPVWRKVRHTIGGSPKCVTFNRVNYCADPLPFQGLRI